VTRVEKWFTSFGFAVRKAYRKILTAKPSVFVVAITVVAVSLFLLGGGVYDFIAQPLPAYSYGQTILFFYPFTLSGQAIIESIGVMIAYAMGFAGLLLLYQSTKYAYKPRQAYMMLLVGVVLIVIAYFYVEGLLSSKLSVGQ
jgi:hypothetical protein